MQEKEMVSVFIITYNEELLLPYTIKWYRKRFPDCPITIVDNFSTDDTVRIATAWGCSVLHYFSNDQLDDKALIDVKNQCWKLATTPWVIACDCDEWLDICPKDLETDATIFRTSIYQMVGMNDRWEPLQMDHGVFLGNGFKFLCFNRMAVKEMNYQFGAHYAFPWGDIKFSEKIIPYYHYKWITLKYVQVRHASLGKRLSNNNLRLKLAHHYLFSARKQRKEFMALRKQAKKIPQPEPRDL